MPTLPAMPTPPDMLAHYLAAPGSARTLHAFAAALGATWPAFVRFGGFSWMRYAGILPALAAAPVNLPTCAAPVHPCAGVAKA